MARTRDGGAGGARWQRSEFCFKDREIRKMIIMMTKVIIVLIGALVSIGANIDSSDINYIRKVGR